MHLYERACIYLCEAYLSLPTTLCGPVPTGPCTCTHIQGSGSLFPHMWMHLELFMCHTCLHIYRHVCACTTYMYTFADTSNPAGANYSFHLPIPGSDDRDGEREGRGRGAPTPHPSINRSGLQGWSLPGAQATTGSASSP